MNERLQQLETGAWILTRHEDGERRVADIFGRGLITCSECGMCWAEWWVEASLHGCAGETCCDAE